MQPCFATTYYRGFEFRWYCALGQSVASIAESKSEREGAFFTKGCIASHSSLAYLTLISNWIKFADVQVL